MKKILFLGLVVSVPLSACTLFAKLAVSTCNDGKNQASEICFSRRDSPSQLNQPSRLAAGDLNGDSRQDLVVAADQQSSLSLLLDQPDGGFQAVPSVQVQPFNVVGLAVGDINNNGSEDIVFGDGGTLVRVFEVLTNQPPPQPSPVVATGTARAAEVALADLNGDGSLDVISTDPSSNQLFFWFNDGAGDFPNTQSVPSNAANMQNLRVADLNKDGHPDFFFANNNSLSVFLTHGGAPGPQNVIVDPQQVINVGPNPIGAAPGDFTGSGNLDLAIPCQGTRNVFIASNDGSGHFSPNADPIDIEDGGARDVTTLDIDHDGLQDIVVTGDQELIVLLSNGDQTFSLDRLQPENAPQMNRTLTMSLNNDGFDDLAIITQGNGSVMTLLGSN